MKVFASQFLETMSSNINDQDDWSWEPANNKAYEIFASGASTSTRESTYAAETDNRSDSDRPNEGLMAV
jgi:hypothetical protein